MDIQKSLKQNSWKYSVSELPRSAQYHMIDLIKFFCTYFIVRGHSLARLPFLGYKAMRTEFFINQSFARLAVPYYFCAAGFFLFRKFDLDNFDADAIRSYLFKTLKIYAVWLIISPPTYSYHLWFMPSLVIAVLLLAILIWKKVSLSKIAILSLILYSIGFIGNTYIVPIESLKAIPVVGTFVRGYFTFFTTTRNGLFMGFPFVFMGLLFAKRKIVLSKGASICGLIVSMTCIALEAVLNYRGIHDISAEVDIYFSALPGVFFLFYIASHIQLPDKPIYKKFRVAGMLIYYSHMSFLFLAKTGLLSFSEYIHMSEGASRLIIFFFVAVCSTAFGFLVEWLSHKEKFSFLKYLYS